MTKDIFFEIHQGLPREGPGRNKYTRKAFQMLPKMDRPRILDVGCGPGAPTMELTRLTNGQVTGLDNHQSYLDELGRKIRESGLSDRAEAVHGSMFAMDFPEESFDIIWAEGSIYIIGFEKGLKEWKRFLVPQGFLVAHEMTWLLPDPPQEINDYWKKFYPGISTGQKNLEVIQGCGYKVLGHFPLPEDAWWKEYYGPLQERIESLRRKYSDNPQAHTTLDNEQQEIDIYRKYSKWYGSVFYIMQKK
ncbi:class I SAM-dependent methyltransferase [Acidobacteriota bacterium]